MPAWKRERLIRAEDRHMRKMRGATTPRMQTIALVELEAIDVPDWAIKKAVPGLSRGPRRIWLRRIAARSLARLDMQAGGSPRLTFEDYRQCRVCGCPRLGLDAEARLELDRKFEGWKIPCSPDCLEVAQRGISKKSAQAEVRRLLRQRKQRAG